MNKKLMVRLAVLFAFVVAISAAVIYFTVDIRTLEYLTMFEPRCILLALARDMLSSRFSSCVRILPQYVSYTTPKITATATKRRTQRERTRRPAFLPRNT